MSKRLKFDHTTKWYIHKSESVLENEAHKILWDFKIQTNQQIPDGRPELVFITKENLASRGFWRFGAPQSENKRKWKDR